MKLFEESASTVFTIAEVAHIIAASSKGPRGSTKASDAELRSYENLVLLCVICHTKIDKCEKDYPESLLKKWKSEHVKIMSQLFGVVKFKSRQEAFDAIQIALKENQAIHHAYGPEDDYNDDPESEKATIWKKKVVTHINTKQLQNTETDRQKRPPAHPTRA